MPWILSYMGSHLALIIATVLALVGAFKFTARYPEHRRAIAQSAAPLV